MKKIRIGIDIKIEWRITTNGAATPLEGRDLTIELTDVYGAKNVLPFTSVGNVASVDLAGINQKRLGKYSLTMWENRGKVGQNAVDKIDAFELVRTSEEMAGDDDSNLETVTIDLETSDFKMVGNGKSYDDSALWNAVNDLDRDKAEKTELAQYETMEHASANYQPKGDYLTEHQSLKDYAKKTEIPTELSQLRDDAQHRLVTDEEKEKWNEDNYPVAEHTEVALEIAPNVYHKWGSVASLTITLGAGKAGIVNEYNVQFFSGTPATTLSDPSDVVFVGGTPKIEENKTYILNIVNKIAVIAAVDGEVK